MSYTREQLERWLKTIEVKGSVLDVGGSQNPIKGRTKSWDVDIFEILDLKNPHKGEDPDYSCDINTTLGELRELGQFETVSKKVTFDNIFMIEVSEYLWNPIVALQNIYSLMHKGGIFYSSWHFIYPQHPPIGLDYLRYTPAGVEKLLTESGFKIIDHIPRTTERSNLEALWQSEQMRGWKGFDNNVIGSLVKAVKI